MPEQLDLTTPLVVQLPAVTSYKVIELRMNWPLAEIDITLADQLGKTITASYRNSQAAALMATLNTANLSTKSLQKRAIEKLQADGKLPAGTITGTP